MQGRTTKTTDCASVRELLIDFEAERLDAGARARVAAHLEGCAACRQAAALEAELTSALDRLPRHHAPAALRRRLAAMVAPPAAVAKERPGDVHPAEARKLRAMIVAMTAVLAVLVVAFVAQRMAPRGESPAAGAHVSADLVAEVVNDHLRVVSSTHPVDIESGGIHQVKPWFLGRLEFAPRVTFSGDADFPLVGGSVGYVHDRRAAVFVFKRRLHTITLLVFPPDGLGMPDDARAPVRLGRLAVTETSARGFSVLLWRDGELGYALVSDVNRQDLEQLAVKINE
jgi:anti-sigma factor RsiW